MEKALVNLTRMMLLAVDKRLSRAERDLWQRQAWMLAKFLGNKFGADMSRIDKVEKGCGGIY